MNNFLPLLMIMMLSQNKNGGFSLDSLAPFIEMMGIDKNALNMLNGPLANLQSGNFSIEKLLPLAMSMMGNDKKAPFIPQNTQKEEKESAEDISTAPNYLKPISSIADEKVNYALAHYFANN